MQGTSFSQHGCDFVSLIAFRTCLQSFVTCSIRVGFVIKIEIIGDRTSAKYNNQRSSLVRLSVCLSVCLQSRRLCWTESPLNWSCMCTGHVPGLPGAESQGHLSRSRVRVGYWLTAVIVGLHLLSRRELRASAARRAAWRNRGQHVLAW